MFKSINRLLLVIVILSMLTCACSRGRNGDALSSAAPSTGGDAQTELPSAEPSPEPDIPEWLTDPYEENAFYAEHRAAAEAVLRGGEPEEYRFITNVYPNHLGVWFDLASAFSGGELIAYDIDVHSSESKPLMEGASLSEEARAILESHIVARYPGELAPLIQQGLITHAHEWYGKEFANEDEPFYGVYPGFCGEDWLLAATITDSHFQVHTILRTDDGENWYEFGHIQNDDMFTVTGASVLNESTAFICCCGGAYTYTEGTPFYSVYATFDGGESWERLPLTVQGDPAWYGEDGTPLFYGQVFAPSFEGDHGVILILVNLETEDSEGRGKVCGWFETQDGGHSWEFHQRS